MATQSTPENKDLIDYNFIDQVNEDYFCKQCKCIARDPNITSCCGECFCKVCIDDIIQGKKPCPSCEETGFSSLLQRKYQSKIRALTVHCTMKERGCEWAGQLQHLDAHLNLTTGDCVYVDIECPKGCTTGVQKCKVDAHLAKECPNRDHICPHCSFRGTFRVVSEHFEVCRYYPLVCPNRCGATFERDDLEDHMKMCRLEKIQCEFRFVGCQANFIRDNQDKHMEKNTQQHLALIAAAMQKQQEMFEKKLDLRREQHEQEKRDFEQRVEQKLGEQQKEFHKQLQHRDEEMKQMKQVLEEKMKEKDEQTKQAEQKFEELTKDLEKKLDLQKEQHKQEKRDFEQKLGEQQKEFHKQLQQRDEELKHVLEEKMKQKDEQTKQTEQKLKEIAKDLEKKASKKHSGVFHCCSYCSKTTKCGCGCRMHSPAYDGCGHGHQGHPGGKHWSCCASMEEKSIHCI